MTESNKIETTRVVIIGSGFVGSTAAFTLMVQGIASEIVLVDVNKEKSQGEAMDIEHGLPFVPGARVWAGEYSDCADADVVVITAGIGQKPGQTRLELASTNTKIVREIVKQIVSYTKDAIILMVTNPLDVMTYIALKESGFSKNQVFGTGTTLDSSRLKYLLAQEFDVSPDSVDAYMFGEHGDSEFPALSSAHIMGESIKNFPAYNEKKMQEISEQTKHAAGEIISKKGATYYAIALVIARMVRAILHNENYAFPVSTLLEGEYGFDDVCVSVPALIGRKGVQKIIPVTLSQEEQNQLQKSVEVITLVLQEVMPK
ncbi:MAG: L-lactate dehydrogenase [Candidatus Paceibacterota bacterium]